jgi:hypothetical protein
MLYSLQILLHVLYWYLSSLRRVGAEAVEGITEIESITRGLTKQGFSLLEKVFVINKNRYFQRFFALFDSFYKLYATESQVFFSFWKT